MKLFCVFYRMKSVLLQVIKTKENKLAQRMREMKGKMKVKVGMREVEVARECQALIVVAKSNKK